MSGAPASSASRSSGTSGSPSRCPASSSASPARSMRSLNNFADPRGLHYSQSGDFVMMAVMGGMRTFWGPAARRRRVRRPAGLSFEHHGQLDVVRRPAVRARRAVLPARPARLHPPDVERRMNVLDIRNVTKRFGSLVAVRDVSLAVQSGELRAIIGPNGAGKTTFFNLISGFFAPDRGRDRCSTDATSRRCRRTGASRSAWRARSRSPRFSRSSRCSRMCASAPR